MKLIIFNNILIDYHLTNNIHTNSTMCCEIFLEYILYSSIVVSLIHEIKHIHFFLRRKKKQKNKIGILASIHCVPYLENDIWLKMCNLNQWIFSYIPGSCW